MPAPRVEIRYCRRCRFVLRAGWLAQELLFSLGEHLGEVALVPGDGGIFELWLDGEPRARTPAPRSTAAASIS